MLSNKDRQLAILCDYNCAGPQDLSANTMPRTANGEHDAKNSKQRARGAGPQDPPKPAAVPNSKEECGEEILTVEMCFPCCSCGKVLNSMYDSR
jgi:hypothetical protein